MTKKTRRIVLIIFAVIAIVSLVFGSLIGSLAILF